jgi:hypothetical protein
MNMALLAVRLKYCQQDPYGSPLLILLLPPLKPRNSTCLATKQAFDLASTCLFNHHVLLQDLVVCSKRLQLNYRLLIRDRIAFILHFHINKHNTLIGSGASPAIALNRTTVLPCNSWLFC